MTKGGHSCLVCVPAPQVSCTLLAQKQASETVSLPVADFRAPQLTHCHPLALADEQSGGENMVRPCSSGGLGSGPAREPSGEAEHTVVPSARVPCTQAARGQPEPVKETGARFHWMWGDGQPRPPPWLSPHPAETPLSCLPHRFSCVSIHATLPGGSGCRLGLEDSSLKSCCGVRVWGAGRHCSGTQADGDLTIISKWLPRSLWAWTSNPQVREGTETAPLSPAARETHAQSTEADVSADTFLTRAEGL